MRITHVMEQSASSSYDVACRALFQWAPEMGPPFGSCMCVVEPLRTSKPHQHHERESFYICQGFGEITSQGETRTVQAGDMVLFDAFEDHAIRNTSDSVPLQFIAIYWYDAEKVQKKIGSKSYPSSALIFTAPPTPNGDLHLGHISGPFSGADIYRRFVELHGCHAYHSCGQDDHQSYVVRKARQENREPYVLANHNADLIQRTLAQANIVVTNFHKPQESSHHTALTQQAFEKLYSEGLIYAKEVDTPYCVETGSYLYEAHISGMCPHCLAPSDGNACEQCGEPNDCADLREAHSGLGSKGVVLRPTTRLFFRLSAFAEKLAAYHRSMSLPSHLAALTERMLERGLADICVAHPTTWGIPVTVEGYSDHRIYVWFEMAFGYLSSAQEVAASLESTAAACPEAWRKFYSSSDNPVIHFFGFDNGYFHTLLLPAIYMAYDSSLHLPDAYVVNELMSLDGRKFSTSRGHLIWARDLLARADSDYVRYYLASIRPETRKTDFRLQDFEESITTELCGMWQSWISDVLSRCQRNFRGVIPEPGAWNQEQRSFFTRLARLVDEIEESYSTRDFSPSRVCSLVGGIVKEGLRFSSQQGFYDDIPHMSSTARTGMALELLAAKVVAMAIAPIMPKFGQRLFSDLTGETKMEWNSILLFCNGGIRIPDQGTIYFETIDDSKDSVKYAAKAA